MHVHICRTEPISPGQKFSRGRGLGLLKSGSASNVSSCQVSKRVSKRSILVSLGEKTPHYGFCELKT